MYVLLVKTFELANIVYHLDYPIHVKNFKTLPQIPSQTPPNENSFLSDQVPNSNSLMYERSHLKTIKVTV